MYFDLKIKPVKGRCFYTYQTTKKKKEHKENNVFTKNGDDDVEFKAEEGNGVYHITHVNNISHSIYSKAQLYSNNYQSYNSNGLFAHKSHLFSNFKSSLTDCNGVLDCEGYDY